MQAGLGGSVLAVLIDALGDDNEKSLRFKIQNTTREQQSLNETSTTR
jgi:hypothetical protein